MSGLVAFSFLPSSRSNSFSYSSTLPSTPASDQQQRSVSNPTSPVQPEVRTWKSCNSAIAPRQTFPLGQQHVPLTSIPTLGHALLEGKPADIDYVNLVLQSLATCRTAAGGSGSGAGGSVSEYASGESDEESAMPTSMRHSRKGSKRKRRSSNPNAVAGRHLRTPSIGDGSNRRSKRSKSSSGRKNTSAATSSHLPHLDEQGRRHSVDFIRRFSNVDAAATGVLGFSSMALVTTASAERNALGWSSGSESLHGSMSADSNLDLLSSPPDQSNNSFSSSDVISIERGRESTPTINPDGEVMTPEGSICESTDPSSSLGDFANDVMCVQQQQQHHLEEERQERQKDEYLDLRRVKGEGTFNTYDAEVALMEGDDQAAADWFDSIFGDASSAQLGQGLLQNDEALSQLIGSELV